MTDATNRELVLTRVIDAPPEHVFKAWTDPALLKQWFAPLPFTTPVAELDEPPTIRLRSVVGSGDVALSIERFVARRGGRTIDQDVCVVWRMAGDRCVELWSRFADQAACDRFWDIG